uniref:Uncharacterized protein n=1 Tax=Alexandrium monilatum TaxID=311494 RepID=A0A7S4Q5X9_9DINO
MGSGPSLFVCCQGPRVVLEKTADPSTDDIPVPELSASVGTLVYIERRMDDKVVAAWEDTSAAGSTDAGSKRSWSSSVGANAKAMSVLKTAGVGILTISPDKLDKGKLAEFRELLDRKGIDTGSWGVDGAKSVEHLFWEAYEQRGCLLTGLGDQGKLKRITRLVKIKILSDIFGVEHALFSRMQFMHDGQCAERQQLPLKKLVWIKSDDCQHAADNNPEVFYQEKCSFTEDLRVGYRKALQERLGLSMHWQEQHLHEDVNAFRYHTEDNVQSLGYPGLNTLYCIHEITLRVVDPENSQNIGLPQGQEFATTEGDFNFNIQHDEDGLPIGSQLNIWMWARDKQSALLKVPSNPIPRQTPRLTDSADAHTKIVVKSKEARPEAKPEAKVEPKAAEALPAAKDINEAQRTIKRVPLPLMTAQALHNMKARMSQRVERPPSTALWNALEGKKTQWNTVRRMAHSMLDPKYTVDKFNKDLSAFPELDLYLLEKKEVRSTSTADVVGINSGRTIGDEYQRTIGAFFAIYWMVRLGIDGKDGFCFGVDDNWKPIKASAADEKRLFQAEKRQTFFKQGRWDDFVRLLLDANLLQRGRWGVLKVNEKRMTALLALTAIHDIMKLDMLLPEVQAHHAPYHGYVAGDRIGDHDHALAYIMDHFPELLPSFKDLDEEDRRALQFTQCNLCFNHGWFVQAEAPPGAIFTQFRRCLINDHKSKLSSQDVALYFVHWLTDLAGAEPTPLGGSEKFVIKFPLPVLNSFLRSFEIVEQLASSTETEVMETYLKIRWVEHTPSPGPMPTGPSAVARMRLLCMAQMNATRVLQGFEELCDTDKEVLSVEMSRSGCVGQTYSKDIIPLEVHDKPDGPAFLIYYGPAFLQSLGSDSPVQRLAVLAEVYRAARAVWPPCVAKVASSVIVRIDTIKNLSLSAMLEVASKGDVWILVKHNENEAFIERSSKRKLNKFITNGQIIQILDFSSLSVPKR